MREKISERDIKTSRLFLGFDNTIDAIATMSMERIDLSTKTINKKTFVRFDHPELGFTTFEVTRGNTDLTAKKYNFAELYAYLKQPIQLQEIEALQENTTNRVRAAHVINSLKEAPMGTIDKFISILEVALENASEHPLGHYYVRQEHATGSIYVYDRLSRVIAIWEINSNELETIKIYVENNSNELKKKLEEGAQEIIRADSCHPDSVESFLANLRFNNFYYERRNDFFEFVVVTENEEEIEFTFDVKTQLLTVEGYSSVDEIKIESLEHLGEIIHET